MKLLLANKYVKPAIELLDDMALKPAQSRARTKLLGLLREAYARFSEDEYALVCAHAVTDDNGQPVISDEGTFTLKDPGHAEQFATARTELFESLAEVEGPTYHSHRTDLIELFDTWDGELSGTKADAFDALYDALTTKEGQ
ncbi:DUF1617 family protein [Trueperella bialowiezensis]|uniref:Uncharacterized protein n=1 Tax=Trueperella bialowiezensis TaxID=312285 RepID=A0A448PFY8_9ACTO|nr:DUF1617 family protein [Trueperella bialowiezensis]VEI13842.1 Uncharacterised protein [Trueperella bialowiezensis]